MLERALTCRSQLNLQVAPSFYREPGERATSRPERATSERFYGAITAGAVCATYSCGECAPYLPHEYTGPNAGTAPLDERTSGALTMNLTKGYFRWDLFLFLLRVAESVWWDLHEHRPPPTTQYPTAPAVRACAQPIQRGLRRGRCSFPFRGVAQSGSAPGS